MASILDAPEFTRQLFFPRPDHRPGPPGASDRFVPVAPGVRVHCRVHPAPEARLVVVHFHGNGETVADYDDLAPRFGAVGAILACAEYRGYGQSDGVPDLRTVMGDAPVVWDALADLAVRADARDGAGGLLPRVVMGRSLGCACAAEVAGCREPAGVVFESGGADLEGSVRRRRLAHALPLPEADLADFCPRRRLARSRAPLLVLHGAEDEAIPATDARLAYEASGAPERRLVLVPDRGHNDVMLHRTYWNALELFLRFVGEGAGTADPSSPGPIAEPSPPSP